MSRIDSVFKDKKAFIPFIMSGDPDLETTEKLVLEMSRRGADLIELGIPFSDPVAEGEVIQKADIRALNSGTDPDGIFNMVSRLRKYCNVPLAFMTYANPVFNYGYEKFCKRCMQTGIDALIVPDMPFEERDDLYEICEKYDIALISMVAPTSRERLKLIVSNSKGFIYCVSSMGVTGVRTDIGRYGDEFIKELKKLTNIPLAVGFGISGPDQAAKLSEVFDGVIVGSAIVKIIEENGHDCVNKVGNFTEEIKKSINGGV